MLFRSKGNPLGIYEFKDLFKPTVKLINREKGSGTRVLLDEHLRLLGLDGTLISGYKNESLSHVTSAAKVATGEADVAMGPENILHQFPQLEFIPIQDEHYDLVIKNNALNSPVYHAILEILQSDFFKLQLAQFKDYDISDMGKVIHS